MTYFHELQPPRIPTWWPLVLETEVSATHLRFRTRRGGMWREVARSDIRSARPVRMTRWSWPLSYSAGPHFEQLLSTSGQAAHLTLRDGRVLRLGSRDPETLCRVLEG